MAPSHDLPWIVYCFGTCKTSLSSPQKRHFPPSLFFMVGLRQTADQLETSLKSKLAAAAAHPSSIRKKR